MATSGGNYAEAAEVGRSLTDYASYAVGDDWGPALQQAGLDLAAGLFSTFVIDAHPGTNRYIRTAVTWTFTRNSTDATKTKQVAVKIVAQGHAAKLWVNMTDKTKVAWTIQTLDTLRIDGTLVFRGTDGVLTDAWRTFHLYQIRQADIENMQFYGISSNYDDGAVFNFDTVESLQVSTLGFHSCPCKLVAAAGVSSAPFRGNNVGGVHVKNMFLSDFAEIDGEHIIKTDDFAGWSGVYLGDPITQPALGAVTYYPKQVVFEDYRQDESYGNGIWIAPGVSADRYVSVRIDTASIDGPSIGNGSGYEGIHVENTEQLYVGRTRFGITNNFSHKGINLKNCGDAQIESVDAYKYPGDVNGVGWGEIWADSNCTSVTVKNSPNMDTTHCTPGKLAVETHGQRPVAMTNWATAARPAISSTRFKGVEGFNTDLGYPEVWDGAAWQQTSGATGATGAPGIGVTVPIVTATWTAAGIGGSLSTLAFTNGVANAVPWTPNASGHVDQLQIECVTTPGSAGSLCRLGIYNATVALRPGTLLFDYGTTTVDLTTTGSKVSAVAGSPPAVVAGTLYFLCAVTQGAPSPTLPVYRVMSAMNPLIISAAATVQAGRSGYSHTGITGALADWDSTFTIQASVPVIQAHTV